MESWKPIHEWWKIVRRRIQVLNCWIPPFWHTRLFYFITVIGFCAADGKLIFVTVNNCLCYWTAAGIWKIRRYSIVSICKEVCTECICLAFLSHVVISYLMYFIPYLDALIVRNWFFLCICICWHKYVHCTYILYVKVNPLRVTKFGDVMICFGCYVILVLFNWKILPLVNALHALLKYLN